jgi:hypothetical protein
VKRGVYEAGGFRSSSLVFSLGEVILRPTCCSQPRQPDVEEAIRANLMDGVKPLVGCDKTTPALRCRRADLPTIALSGGRAQRPLPRRYLAPHLRGIH